MTTYFSNDFHAGLKIVLDNEPYVIESIEFVKPGKGRSFARVKLRRLLTGVRVEKTFKSTDYVKSADVFDIDLLFLYKGGDKLYHFINNETFEQLAIHENIIGNNTKWLITRSKYTVTLWNSQPIAVTPPNFVELGVINTNPGSKNDTSGNGLKPATLANGAKVKVPLFIQIGEVIKVNTRSNEYVSRVK